MRVCECVYESMSICAFECVYMYMYVYMIVCLCICVFLKIVVTNQYLLLIDMEYQCVLRLKKMRRMRSDGFLSTYNRTESSLHICLIEKLGSMKSCRCYFAIVLCFGNVGMFIYVCVYVCMCVCVYVCMCVCVYVLILFMNVFIN
jgi:hypothetical protein